MYTTAGVFSLNSCTVLRSSAVSGVCRAHAVSPGPVHSTYQTHSGINKSASSFILETMTVLAIPSSESREQVRKLDRTWLENTAHARAGVIAVLSLCATSRRNPEGCCTPLSSAAAPSPVQCLFAQQGPNGVNHLAYAQSPVAHLQLALAQKHREAVDVSPVHLPCCRCCISMQL